MSNETLTCVYCGQAYPAGTPPHSAKVLTDHIKVCKKHPMAKIRAALVRFIGTDDPAELKRMIPIIQADPHAPDDDKASTIGGIQALLETQ